MNSIGILSFVILICLVCVKASENKILDYLLKNPQIKVDQLATAEELQMALSYVRVTGHRSQEEYRMETATGIGVHYFKANKRTILHALTGTCNIPAIKYGLKQAGVNVNVVDGHNGTPLGGTVHSGCPCGTKLMLEAGADVNIVSTNDNHSVLTLVGIQGPNGKNGRDSEEVAKLLLKYGANANHKASIKGVSMNFLEVAEANCNRKFMQRVIPFLNGTKNGMTASYAQTKYCVEHVVQGVALKYCKPTSEEVNFCINGDVYEPSLMDHVSGVWNKYKEGCEWNMKELF